MTLDNAGSRSPKVIIVDRPESPQTVLRIGHVGLSRAHPDYVPVDVMNTTLGGLFSSRINRNLREKNGFTYGASSAFIFRRGPGPFVIGTSVRADATASAVREVFGEIGRMQQERISPEELSAAKDSIAYSLPGLFETAHDTASSVGQQFIYDLPPDCYRNLPEMIQNVSAEDVLRVAQKHLKPREAIVVAVGSRRKIEKGLEQAGWGPVEIRDHDGNLTPA
jgi:zinc protease